MILLDLMLLSGGFAAYLELNPRMGNIWIRDGHFSPIGIINVMKYPFQNLRMWHFDMWDINFPMWIALYSFGKFIMACKKNYLYL